MSLWKSKATAFGLRLVTAARTGWLIVGMTLLLVCLLEGLYRAQGAIRRLGQRSPAEAQESTAPWMAAYLDEQQRTHVLAWRPFVYFRRIPFAGEFINVDAQRHRVTVQAAPHPDAPEVFVFGGSTLFGTFQRDAATIPSVLARELRERHGLTVRVTNFGETGYVFTQEVVELFVQLRSGITPRVTVFYDGINDAAAALQSGQPGLPLNEENRARDFHLGRTVFAWETDVRTQARALANLAAAGASRFELVRWLQQRTQAATPPPDVSRLADSLVATYARTVRLVEAWAAREGFVPVYVWQPTLHATAKPLTAGEQGFQRAHDGDPQQRALRALHQAVATRIDSVVRPLAGWRFVNLSRVFDTVVAPVFADGIGHTYEEANPVIVRALAPTLARALAPR